MSKLEKKKQPIKNTVKAVGDISSDVAQRNLEQIRSGLLDQVMKSEQSEPISPLLSIVVIFDTANEKRWIQSFIERLPKLLPEHKGMIEVVMCKNVKGETELLGEVSSVIANNLVFKRADYTFKNWRFDNARNTAKSIATGEWILSIDTDEYIDDYQFSKLLNEIQSQPKAVGGITCTVISHIKQDIGFGLEAVQNVCRVFRNDPEIMWRSRCHEFIDYSIIAENGYTIADSTVKIIHDGYEEITTQGVMDKFLRNWKLLREEESEPYNLDIYQHAFRYALRTAVELVKLGAMTM